jgi:sulfur relay (sulfurtransferase) DsrF/TusC family protein
MEFTAAQIYLLKDILERIDKNLIWEKENQWYYLQSDNVVYSCDRIDKANLKRILTKLDKPYNACEVQK